MYTEKELIQFLKKNDVESMKLAIKDKQTNLAFRHNTLIQEVAKVGSYELFEILYKDQRIDASDLNNYAFEYATIGNNTQIIKILLRDLNLNYYNLFSGLKHAYQNKNYEILNKIFKSKDFKKTFKIKNEDGFNKIKDFLHDYNIKENLNSF